MLQRSNHVLSGKEPIICQIRQCFPTSKFSHVWYVTILQLQIFDNMHASYVGDGLFLLVTTFFLYGYVYSKIKHFLLHHLWYLML